MVGCCILKAFSRMECYKNGWDLRQKGLGSAHFLFLQQHCIVPYTSLPLSCNHEGCSYRTHSSIRLAATQSLWDCAGLPPLALALVSCQSLWSIYLCSAYYLIQIFLDLLGDTNNVQLFGVVHCLVWKGFFLFIWNKQKTFTAELERAAVKVHRYNYLMKNPDFQPDCSEEKSPA